MNILEEQKAAAWLQYLTEWIMENRGRLLPEATRETMFRYVAYAWLNGRIAVYRDEPNGVIRAVVFYWLDWREHIEHKDALGLQQFEYRPNHKGDCLFIGEVIGNRHAIARMYQDVINRWPYLVNTPFLTYRRGKLVEIPKKRLNQFTKV